MGKNLYQKVFEKHTVATLPGGATQLFIGAHLCHEVTSPQAFAMIREMGLKVKFPKRTFLNADHIIPTDSYERPFKESIAEEMMSTLEKNAREFDLNFYDLENGGVIHVINPEAGITQPGMTIACGDSHTATHGAFGAIAFGIGTSQVRDVLATQTLSMEPLKVRKIVVNGKCGKGVYAKDVILYIISKLGVKGGVGYAYEFAGQVIEDMSMEERMTVCNMAIEGGARVGYINPDQITYDYIKGRKFAPKEEQWEEAVQYWNSIRSDEDASYDDVIEFDASDIAPMVTWGITPGQAAPVTESFPKVEDYEEADRPFIKEAFDYMCFDEGMPLTAIPIDVAFIGSCTNGRLSDFQAAAEIIKGRKVKDGVRALAVPGSQTMKKEAEAIGLDKIFTDAGFEWREAGCSLCLAMNTDKLQGTQVSASSSNRNFKGRQGSPKGRTVLMSPAMVAAAAINGHVTDVRELM